MDGPETTTSSAAKCSKGLFDIFDLGGWGRKKTQRKSEILMLEWMRNVTTKRLYYNCGGFAEGSEMGQSDKDISVIIPHTLVKVNESDEIDNEKYKIIFKMSPVGHRSCYTELELVSNSFDEIQIMGTTRSCTLQDLLESKSDGTKCISSEKLVAKVVDLKQKIPIRDLVSININGPCAAYSFKAGDYGTCSEDNVYAIPGSSWPPEAAEWLTRKRLFQWPFEEIRTKVAELGCLFVPLGDVNSQSYNLEWRISFVLAERLLVWSLNDTQLYCFLLLKLFLRMHKQLVSNMLDTFMVKTTVFWVVEETPESFWEPYNLINCAQACFSKLLEFINSSNLPHYFVKKNNLFTGKMGDMKQVDDVKERIKTILSDMFTYFHTIVGIKCTKEECILCNTKLRSLSMMFGLDVLEGWMSPYSIPFTLYPYTLHLFEYSVSSLDIEKIDTIQKHFDDIPRGILKEHIHLMFQVLYSRLGFQLYKQSLLDDAEMEQQLSHQQMLQEVERLLVFGMTKDAMVGKLQLATFYFMCGRYHDADALINSIFEEKVVIYQGIPFKRQIFKFTGLDGQKREAVDMEWEDLIDSDFLESTTDLYFNFQDWICLPHAVAYECLSLIVFEPRNFDWDSVTVSAIVYMYFLSALIYIHFRRQDVGRVIANMASRVELEKGTELYQVGLNLLGYCYALVGNHEQAIKCFGMSFKELSSTRNACLLYTLMIINEHMAKTKESNS